MHPPAVRTLTTYEKSQLLTWTMQGFHWLFDRLTSSVIQSSAAYRVHISRQLQQNEIHRQRIVRSSAEMTLHGEGVAI